MKKDTSKRDEESQKITPNIADDCQPGYYWDPLLRKCVRYDITANYAGVSITYETNNHILNFNSVNDINTVLDQLDADYDAYNDNYDNQYPNYTVDQLDDIDVTNNFDEFKKFKDFENLFSGFFSKRKQIENTENTWLANNFSGTDPDDIDITFDDAENTIFNSNYSFKVGTSIYEFKTDGLYVNGILQPGTESFRTTQTTSECKSNKKSKAFPEFGNQRFKIKVAINSWLIRSGAKGKAVHYKSNGGWKRSRAEMAVGCGGKIYDSNCSESFLFIDRNPSFNFKKRRQLKVTRHQPGTIWKTFSTELSSSFDTPDPSIAAILPLTY